MLGSLSVLAQQPQAICDHQQRGTDVGRDGQPQIFSPRPTLRSLEQVRVAFQLEQYNPWQHPTLFDDSDCFLS